MTPATLTPGTEPGLWPAQPPAPAALAAAQWRALAPALAARSRMRLSYDGGNTYPRRRRTAAGWMPAERLLSPEPPPMAAAVHVFDDDGNTRLLVADFDTKRAAGRGAVDPAAQVTEDAKAFAELVRSCGGRGFGDISPSNGRHSYVLWAAPVAHAEIRWVAMALARRFTSLDPSPMLGRQDGLIRPPGSRHRSGGFQILTTALAVAENCIAQPCGLQVLQRLCEALHDELEAVQRGQAPPSPPGLETAPGNTRRRPDSAGAPWLPRLSGRIPSLRPDLELTAVTGQFDPERRTYDGKLWTPSEARFAVLCSAAARGWRLEEVTEQMRTGTWAGLARFYQRYPPRHRQPRLAADWNHAIALACGEKPSGGKTGRGRTTRQSNHAGGHQANSADLDLATNGDRQQVRRIDAAMRAVETQRWPGASGIRTRLVMRALLSAAQLTGSTIIEFGCRSLGIGACCDHTTVSRALQRLRAESDPFVALLESRRGVRGDLLMLRIPSELERVGVWWRWRPGRLGVHPLFHALGGPAALVLEQLASEPVPTLDLPGLTGLSATTISAVLAELAAYGLAERGQGGWRRGPADLDQIAAQLGVPALLADLHARHRAERQGWQAWLMRPQAIPAARPDEAPWPDQPLIEDPYYDLGPGRGPPEGGELDEMTAARAVESKLGPTHTITFSAFGHPA